MRILRMDTMHKQLSPGRKPQFIILHGSGGGELGTVNWLGNPSSRVSYHYLLPKDGDPPAYQFMDDDEIGWHAGLSKWVETDKGAPVIWTALNKHSIGVSFESMNTHDEDYTEAQISNGLLLVKSLMRRWGIPVSRVLTHKEVSDPQGRKIDPVNFPLKSFRDALESETDKLLHLRLFLNDNVEGRIARAGIVADKLYLYTEV